MGWVLVRDCRWLPSCYMLMWWTEEALVSVPLTWALIPLWGASQVVLVVKNPPANAEDIRDAGSIPSLGRSPGGGDETSNLITPSKAKVTKLESYVAQTCLTLQPCGLSPIRLLHPWDSPGKSTGVGCHFPLQGIFLAQGWNPDLLHWRQTL